MKKVITFLCICCLIFSSLPSAHAVPRVKNTETPEPQQTPAPPMDNAKGEIDFSSLSLEELLQINQTLQSAIFEKAVQYEGIRIYPGYYEVGIDIPAGKYRVVFPEKEGLVILHVYQNAEKAESHSLINDTYYLEPYGGKEIIGCLNLKEGNIVEFSNGNLIFSSYLGLF